MTIINQTHRFVFVHIPKNAGTSVSQYLSQVSTYRDIEIGATELGEARALLYRRRFKLHKHSTHKELERVMGSGELASYTTFAVVRDPYDRVRSIFSFLRSWKGWTTLDQFKAAAEEFDRYADIEDFVRSDFFLTPGPDRLFMPQVTWVADEDPRTVRVDRLLRFDSLVEDMAALVRDLRLPADALKEPLRHANASQGRLKGAVDQIAQLRGGKAAGLSPVARQRVEERYEHDIRLLEGVVPASASG